MPRKQALIENPEEITLTEQDEIQEILGHPPGWILRWGITVILFVVAMLLVLSWVVKYPDVIPASIELTTENPVIPLVARQSGKLSLLLVQDQEKVDSGQVLAILENPANYVHIQQLAAMLDQTDQLEEAAILDLNWPKNLDLGPLQSTYASFTQKLSDYAFFGEQRAVYRKIRSLREQKENLFNLNKSLERQRGTLQEEKNLAQTKLERDQELLKSGAVSKEDVERSKAAVLQYDRQLENLTTQVLNNEVRIENLEVQIIDLQQRRKEDQNFKELSIQEHLDRLKGDLDAWRQEYALIAPVDGQVVMSTIWSPQQPVAAGTEVMLIVPEEGTGAKFGRGELPIAGSGKVEEGFDVNISLAGYPSQEFGQLRGTVKKIAPVPLNKATYLVEISLPDPLITTYKDTIPFSPQLSGTAEIITEDRRLIERFLDKIWDLFKNS